jgi:hypothetical protein
MYDIYAKADAFLLRFFQWLTFAANKICITSGLLANCCLLFVFYGLGAQLYYLYKAGESLFGAAMFASPTAVLAAYFYWRIKVRNNIPVNLDLFRLVASLFGAIVLFNLSNYAFATYVLGGKYFIEHPDEFKSHVVHTIAFIALPCFLFFLSCTDRRPITDKRRLLQE